MMELAKQARNVKLQPFLEGINFLNYRSHHKS